MHPRNQQPAIRPTGGTLRNRGQTRSLSAQQARALESIPSGSPGGPAHTSTPQVSYFQAASETVANDNRFTTVVVNIHESALDNILPSQSSNLNNQANLDGADRETVIQDGRGPRTEDTRQTFTSRRQRPQTKCNNEIYHEHLLHKRRGSPLWIPQANMNLPVAYRAKGVSIGDVGVLTPSGAFDFLFNICLPANDPINPEDLPQGFKPISGLRNHIRTYKEYGPGSYLASSSVSKRGTHHPFGMTFESSESEGAVLTMPEGAFSEDLRNVSVFREYAAEHAKSWYSYANGPLGLEIPNGGLRLVIGCDNATSWGMATFANSSQENSFRVHFRGVDESVRQSTGVSHIWENSCMAEVRAGPSIGENEELGETENRRLRNQSLFVRNLTVRLAPEIWKGLSPRQGVLNHHRHPKRSRPGAPGGSRQRPNHSQSSSTSTQPSGTENAGPPSETPADLAVLNNNDRRGHSLEALPHPSELINDILLRMSPEAKMAVTSDRDWRSLLPANWGEMDKEAVFESICYSKTICEENNVVFLRPIEYTKETRHKERDAMKKVVRNVETISSIQHYLFGSQRSRCDLLRELVIKLKSQNIANSYPLPIDQVEPLEGHPNRLLTLDEISALRSGRLTIGTIIATSTEDLRAQEGECPPGMLLGRLTIVQKVGHHLLKRFWRYGEIDDLDEAIHYHREAMALVSTDNYIDLEAILGLCSALYKRVQLLGEKADVEELIVCLERQAGLDVETLLQPIATRLAAQTTSMYSIEEETSYADIVDPTSLPEGSELPTLVQDFNTAKVPALGWTFGTLTGNISFTGNYIYEAQSAYDTDPAMYSGRD